MALKHLYKLLQLLWYCLATFAVGCNQQYVRNDTCDILSACIEKTIGIGNQAKMAYRFTTKTPPAMPYDDSVVTLRTCDSIKNILDAADCYISLNDTLKSITLENIESIKHIINEFSVEKRDYGFINIENWQKSTASAIDVNCISHKILLPVERYSRIMPEKWEVVVNKKIEII